MIPDCPVSSVSVLQQIGSMQCFFSVIFVFFCICTRSRINLFKLSDRKRRSLRILPFKRFIKVRQFRLTLFKLCDDKPHLIAPVSQMDIPDHVISLVAKNPFNTLPDDRRTQMPNMQRLRHIRPAVVDHNGLRRFLILNSKLFLRSHIIQIGRYTFFRQLQVDKARLNHIYCLKV